MKLLYPQLTQHLAQTLAPLYFISGDELLLVSDAADAIRKAAKLKGYERTVVTVEGTDWGKQLYAHAHSLSFFSEKKLIEINLCHLKINQTHGKILEEYALNMPTDTLLLILTAKLDSKLEKSKWFQAISTQGMVVTCWPIPVAQLPQWIMERAKKYNLNMHKDAALQLAEWVEGNLFAAAQEIEKLSLLPNLGEIRTIDSNLTDHTRFDIYNLVDSALAGDSARSVRIIDNLLLSDVPPTLLLWTLVRELRTMADMKKNLQSGAGIAQVFNQFRVWEKRKPVIRAFIERHTLKKIWQLLVNSARIDRIIKGAELGNFQTELKGLALSMAGNDIIK